MGKRKTEEDYRRLAESREFEWVGIFPHTIVKKTEWKCSKGHTWFGRFNDIQNGIGCPICAGVARKVEGDYHALARQRGFKWIGKKIPKNTKTRTKWRCRGGHIWTTTYSSISGGGGCPICYGNLPKTKGDYYALAEKRGFDWVGKDLPKNNKAKTSWCCSRNHIWQASFGSILRGRGCPVCYGRIPKTPDDYHALGQKRGFRWLGPKVENTGIKTWWQCEFNHRWERTYNDIQQGSGCPFCANKAPKTPVDYHELAMSHGFKWRGPEVSTTKDKTQWECKEGHIWETTYGGLLQGSGCPYCSNKVQKVNNDYIDLALERGYIWLGPEVPNVHTKTWWQCEFNHRWQAVYHNIQSGSGCPDCANLAHSERMRERWASGEMDDVFQSPTSIEIETAEALDDLKIEHISQYRPNGYSRIYDEFIPPNLLLELHGDYWHGPERPEQQKKDVEKAGWAKDNDFILIVFWEHEIKVRGPEALIREYVLPLL